MDTEVIYCDDNLHRLALLPPNSVNLIYLDPPFFSNRYYEVIWGDEAEVRSFEDRWEGGIHHYVSWMKERVLEMRRVLNPKGSFYLHCDWHASHYLKQMLDDVFGINQFRNEIVWAYKTGGTSKRYFARKHDTILFYVKSNDYTFNPQKDKSYVRTLPEPHTLSGKRLGIKMDEVGHKYRYVIARDVWEIEPIYRNKPEHLGYPTQKPEELLGRIIEASSNKDDIVLDPFAGCGTSIVVSERLGRHWIGIDISPTACNLMKRRLAKVGTTNIKLVGMPTTIEDLKKLKPFEFQNWIVDRINGIQSNKQVGDMGIDGWTWMLHDPIQIKQSEGIGREVVDKFETAMERVKKTNGFIIAFSFTRGTYEEVARIKNGLTIHLIKVQDILDNIDAIYSQMGITAGLPDFANVPMPQINVRAHSAEELLESQRTA